MTGTPLSAYLDRLDQSARTASENEDSVRKDLMKRLRELEDERAFAFRRLNLMRSIAASVSEAKDEAEASQRASETLLQDLGWSGGSELQKQVVEQFSPVAVAVWKSAGEDEADKDPNGEAIERELSEFERWFAEARNISFPNALGREVVELPLVEIS